MDDADRNESVPTRGHEKGDVPISAAPNLVR